MLKNVRSVDYDLDEVEQDNLGYWSDLVSYSVISNDANDVVDVQEVIELVLDGRDREDHFMLTNGVWLSLVRSVVGYDYENEKL